MLGLKSLEGSNAAKAAKIQPLFVTIDPARDTPAVLTQFTNAFHPRLIGLTGSDAQIAAMAKTFAVIYAKGETSSPTAYLMDHSRTTILFDPKGAPIAIIPEDGKPADIAAALERWVQ
jgi:protein SCO1